MTTVVHCMKETYDIYIGRGRCPKTGAYGKWGNPFSHKSGTMAKFKVATREEAIQQYRGYLESKPDLLAALPELQGKVLGCWCVPLNCHGNTLAEFADRK